MCHIRVVLGLLASLTAFAVGAKAALAQYSTDFEEPLYTSGALEFQDDWEPFGSNYPRVQTAAEIAQELDDAGLNSDNAVHSGDQAMLYTYNPPDESGQGGGLMRRRFTGLEEETNVVMEWWARPLTPGSEGSTIGFDQGNTFVGIQDDVDAGDGGRAAALRFGVIRDPENPDNATNIIGHTIDWASNTAGSAVWVPSGLSWEADTWYNFRFHLDYENKEYDLFVNGSKANEDPIVFYRPTSKFASTVFVSRGTNQAGQIIDDMSVDVAPPGVPGDFDNDGDVDGSDFLAWQRDPGIGELSDWEANFGGGGQALAVAVPEPGSVCLVAVMGWTVLCYRKRNS